MNYKFSFRVKPVNKATELPNMNTLSNEFQQLIKKYNLQVDGWLFEHDEFTPFHSKDFYHQEF